MNKIGSVCPFHFECIGIKFPSSGFRNLFGFAQDGFHLL